MAKKTTKKKAKTKRSAKPKLWIARERTGEPPELYSFSIDIKAPKYDRGLWGCPATRIRVCSKQWDSLFPPGSKYRLKPGEGPVEVKLVE